VTVTGRIERFLTPSRDTGGFGSAAGPRRTACCGSTAPDHRPLGRPAACAET
jgi:hypothetical protein